MTARRGRKCWQSCACLARQRRARTSTLSANNRATQNRKRLRFPKSSRPRQSQISRAGRRIPRGRIGPSFAVAKSCSWLIVPITLPRRVADAPSSSSSTPRSLSSLEAFRPCWERSRCGPRTAGPRVAGCVPERQRSSRPANQPRGSSRSPRVNGWYRERARETVFLVWDGHDSVRAMSATCTHLGCQVQWDGEGKKFKCPCHGGVYSHDGSVCPVPRRGLSTSIEAKINPDDASVLVRL